MTTTKLQVPHSAPIGTAAWAALASIVALGVLLRTYWVAHQSGVLEGNGCEYARIAENLLARGGYVGLFEGPELMFPPLYPMLLALGVLLVGSLDLAVRVVPFIAGALIIPAAFALGRMVYGPRVGLTFAALVAVHPLLIDLSSTAYSEGVYLPLMLAGLYWGLRSLQCERPAPAVLAGVAFGLASLTRPEGFLYPLVIVGIGLVWELKGSSAAWRFVHRSLLMLVPFVVLVAPYAAYLSLQTGTLRLEGKGLMNYTIGERRNAGMSPAEAALGIGPDLSEQGPQLSPNHFVLATHRHLSMADIVSYWVTSARRNRPPLQQILISPAFGSFLTVGLVALGLLGQPWSRWRAVNESVLVTVSAGHLVLLLGLHFIMPRYLLPLLIVLLLWVAKGIDQVTRWSLSTARHALPGLRLAGRPLAAGIRCGLIAGVVLLAFWGVRWGPLQTRGDGGVFLRDVGTWLAHYQPGRKRVMTGHPEISYYSTATFLPLPYAEASLGLRYVEQKDPDFIVLTGQDRAMMPYVGQWLEEGIPDAAAKLIYRAGRSGPDAVAIYEWRPRAERAN